ncbi:unnamed protein product [Absidia cylindrospora]
MPSSPRQAFVNGSPIKSSSSLHQVIIKSSSSNLPSSLHQVISHQVIIKPPSSLHQVLTKPLRSSSLSSHFRPSSSHLQVLIMLAHSQWPPVFKPQEPPRPQASRTSSFLYNGTHVKSCHVFFFLMVPSSSLFMVLFPIGLRMNRPSSLSFGDLPISYQALPLCCHQAASIKI